MGRDLGMSQQHTWQQRRPEHPGLHEWDHGQEIKGRDYPPLLSMSACCVSSFGPPRIEGTSKTWSEFSEGLLEALIRLVKAEIPEKNTCIHFMVCLNESTKTR